MLIKIIETDEKTTIKNIHNYVEKRKLSNIKGCESKKVYNDFLIFCEENKCAPTGYFMFRKILMSTYNLKSKQICLNNDERIYIFY